MLASLIAAISESAWKRKFGEVLPRRLSWGFTFVIFVLAGISSLRLGVGADYWAYDRNFEMYAREVPKDLSLIGEPGIRILAWVAMVFTGDSASMFAMAAFITIGLLLWPLWRWSPAFAFSIAVFVLSGVWHGTFNGIRQYLACAILFAGHKYIQNRQFSKWMPVVLVAALFHFSAIVAIFLYFVPTRRTSAKIQIALLALGVIGMFGMAELMAVVEQFTGDEARWSSDYAERGLNPLRVVFAFIPLSLYWLLNVRDEIKEKNIGFYINVMALYAAAYLASSTSAMVARFLIYLLPYLSIGLVYVTQVKDKKERTIVRFFVLLIFGLFFYFEIASSVRLREFHWIFERV